MRYRRNAVEAKLCEHAKYLAQYLNIEFDPYDFGSYVGIWPDAEPQWEMFEDVPEERHAEFVEWVKEKVIPRAHMNDPLSLPAYLFFEKAKTLPAGTWLVHFSRNSFLSFKKGATLETLALSTHTNAKTLTSCEANLDPDSGLYDTVWGFAIEAEGLSHRNLRDMKHYGDQVMLFQTDCAVSAWHTTDNFEQVIFPLCSEYNVHRGSYDGHVLSFESAEDDGEYKEFESLDDVIADAEAGALVPNAGSLIENPAGTFTLYHGTHARFDKPTEFRVTRGGADYGPGFYMTTDPREAAEYGRYVYVATVKLENPLDLLEDDPEALKKLQRGLRITDEDLEHADNKTLEALRLANLVYSQKGIRNLLMRLGYDGIYADHRLVEHPRTDVSSDFVSVLSLEQILSWELVSAHA